MSFATLKTPARQLDLFRGDGRTLDHDRDDVRLGRQMAAVLLLMKDGAWRGLAEVAAGTGAPEASCSARLRDVNKAKNARLGWQMESQYVARGLWLYRLVPAGVTHGVD